MEIVKSISLPTKLIRGEIIQLGMVVRPMDWPGSFVAYVVGEYDDPYFVKLQFVVWDEKAIFDLDANIDGSPITQAQAEAHAWSTTILENASEGWCYNPITPGGRAKYEKWANSSR